MGVRFIIGRAHSGKTRWCLEQITASLRERSLGPAIYWILPRQATFQAQRELACGLGGYFRVRVVSFDDLGRDIIEECGGTAIPEVTELGRRMILGRLLRQLQPKLGFFQQVAHQPGVAAALDSTFSELERSGQDVPQMYEQMAADAGPPSLRAKLRDLGLIYGEYSKFLGQDRLDPQRRLNEALASIKNCRGLRDADVYVDGFYDFTDYERRVLAGLGSHCKSVSITMMMDSDSACIADARHAPAEMSLFHRTEHTYQRLCKILHENAVRRLPAVILRSGGFDDPALARLERWDDSATEDIPASVELIEAPDQRSEVDAAARQIRQLVASGMRYRDIAVLMRNNDEYDETIAASFKEHNIPFFVDRRRTAAHHPLLQFVRAAVNAARNHYSHEPMMTLIKSGLMGINADEADELENYVLLHGIQHGTWVSEQAWTGSRRIVEEDADDAPARDPMEIENLRRRVSAKLEPFVKAVMGTPTNTVKVFSSAIFKLLEDCQARATIVNWMEEAAARERLDQQGEHERVWEELVKLFDELVDLLGEEQVTPGDFQAILDTGLESFELAMTPPTVDQVLVGQVDRTRTPAIKACFVLGLNEGQFPRVARESSVFSDVDRRALRERNVDVEPDTQRKLFDEQLLGYIAFTRASEKLFLLRSATEEDGKPASESVLWRRVRETFPQAVVRQVPRQDQLPLEMIATPRQLITSLMRWVRQNPSQGDQSWQAVYQWLAGRKVCDDAVDTMRFRAWKALSYANEAKLSPEIARRMFTSPLKARARQLESFANCPYQHFLRHGLGLKEREQRKVGAMDMSSVYHDVLEHFLQEQLKAGQDWLTLDEKQMGMALDRLTKKIGHRLRAELMLSNARNRYLLDRIRQTLHAVVAAQRAAAAQGQLRAAYAGVKYGEDETLPALDIRTPQGNQVLISGKIDRVDIDGGDAAIVDYKLTAGKLAATQVFHGLSLQLLASLLALQECGKSLSGKNLTPMAGLCVQLLRYVQDGDPNEAVGPEDPKFHLQIKPRGIFDAAVVAKLDSGLVSGASEVVLASINKDGSFGRRETTDVAEPGELAGLLKFVRERIGKIADRILSGQIDIKPYKIGRSTPCPRCEFRDVCRFDPVRMPYVQLRAISRSDLLKGDRLDGGGE